MIVMINFGGWKLVRWMDLIIADECHVMYQHYNYSCTVHDVVTDWSYALTGFLVSQLFSVSPGANPSNFSHCKCFLSGFSSIRV